MKRDVDRARAARQKQFVRLEVEILEPRNLPSGTGLLTDAIPNVGSLAAGPDALTAVPGPAVNTTPGSGTSTSPTGATYPLSSVPALSSLPGARDSIWLNFTGDFQSQWGSYSNITTPAFGDGTTFTSSELQIIQQTWQVVAEKYAPFNIDVTTVQPANLGHGYTQQVDIGGNGAWTGGDYGGLTYVGSFADPSLPNTSYVFSDNLYNDPIYMGDAISHEAGHGFGLVHQSVWNADGTLANEYNPGNAAQAPIMGYPYSATRAMWWDGVSENGPTAIQDDMAIIASAANGFGYKPEPSNTSAATATRLTVSGNQVSGSGLVIHTTDKDYFSFTTGAGQISLSLNVALGNNLAPTITLLGPDGQTVVASDDPSPNFNAAITTTVAAGTYYLEVGSHGGYDDDGQYTISGTIVPASPPPKLGSGQNVAIDAGGAAAGNFTADGDFSGGSTYGKNNTIDTSGVSNPAPQTVYQTERYGNFTYTIPNLTPGANYTVRLDFAEIYWNAAGQRLFNVSIDGLQVLTNFDIFASAGGKNIAIAESFTATANSAGRIVITFTSVKDNAKVSGIEIVPLSSPPQSVLGTGANAQYVENIYVLLLHRSADLGGLTWVNLLNQGISPAVVVGDIEGSYEYLNDLVTALYERYLNRAPDLGAQTWVQALQGGAAVEQVVEGILGSAEFFQKEGSTNNGFLAALYQDVLNRTGDASGNAFWLQALAGGVPRSALAAAFMTSAEYRGDLVGAYYASYLGRAADADGLAAWLAALQAGATDQQVLADILGSAEGRSKWS